MFLDIDRKEVDKQVAVDVTGNKMSYGKLCDIMDVFSVKYGMERNVAVIICRNDIPTLVAYLSCMNSRVVPLMLSVKMDIESVRRLIKIYKPSYIIGHEEDVLGLNIERKEEEFFEDFIDYKIFKTGYYGYELYDELSLLLTTSGSTGSPKLVRHSYSNIIVQARNVANLFSLSGNERAIVSLPLMYTMGLSIVNSHLIVGATLLLTDDSLLSKSFVEFISNERASSFTGVPYSYELLHRVRLVTRDLPNLRMMSQGGGKMSKALQEEFATYMKKKGGEYIATYGQTEGTARMAFLPSEYALTKYGSIGHAIPGGKLYLVDENGNKIENPNIEGEMVYEGPNVTLGYAQKGEDLLLKDERKGVLFTGDIAYYDADGMFYITGRKKRFLKLFGHRVSLDECETIIHTVVEGDVACVGDDSKLIVYTTQKGVEAEIKKLLIEKTELYPHGIEVRWIVELPRSSAGKIAYSRL